LTWYVDKADIHALGPMPIRDFATHMHDVKSGQSQPQPQQAQTREALRRSPSVQRDSPTISSSRLMSNPAPASTARPIAYTTKLSTSNTSSAATNSRYHHISSAQPMSQQLRMLLEEEAREAAEQAKQAQQTRSPVTAATFASPKDSSSESSGASRPDPTSWL
jgi:hypothetical protein